MFSALFRMSTPFLLAYTILRSSFWVEHESHTWLEKKTTQILKLPDNWHITFQGISINIRSVKIDKAILHHKESEPLSLSQISLEWGWNKGIVLKQITTKELTLYWHLTREGHSFKEAVPFSKKEIYSKKNLGNLKWHINTINCHLRSPTWKGYRQYEFSNCIHHSSQKELLDPLPIYLTITARQLLQKERWIQEIL